MIKIRLREIMNRLGDERGEKVTYRWLAEQTGIGKSRLEEIGSLAKQRQANPTLDAINLICHALGCTPCDLLEYEPNPEGGAPRAGLNGRAAAPAISPLKSARRPRKRR